MLHADCTRTLGEVKKGVPLGSIMVPCTHPKTKERSCVLATPGNEAIKKDLLYGREIQKRKGFGPGS